MKSMEDLERLKEETLQDIRLRASSGSPRIVVGMGTCGIAAGARETMLAIIDEIKVRRKFDVTISETGCIGLCAKEPIVEVHIPGQPKVVYGNVDPSRGRQIVVSHIVNLKPIDQWILNVEDNS
ncbi:MAG TPA: (2Fe-2S) ferredoxin domain-containing protein [Firmicutes bacterium]|jgi:NADP-reducing hydrogenase subunit HndB|nr:(2Fe-2S) ferredoxin domain-containing protein [Bacillota bacterium]